MLHELYDEAFQLIQSLFNSSSENLNVSISEVFKDAIYFQTYSYTYKYKYSVKCLQH